MDNIPPAASHGNPRRAVFSNPERARDATGEAHAASNAGPNAAMVAAAMPKTKPRNMIAESGKNSVTVSTK